MARDNINLALGKRVKQIRKKLGLSQEDVARAVNINRVTLSKIENGEKKINIQEAVRLADFFNVSLDDLINENKDIELVIENSSKSEKKPGPEIRISIPQRNLKKFKEVLLYILTRVGSKPNIGETVLYKLLYFIDFNYYEKYEEQLIGATYIKNTYGPTPKEFIKVIEEMEKNREIEKVTGKYFKYPQTKYLPLREPDLSVLKASEIKVIDDVLNKLSDMNAAQISDYSHKDVPWITAEDGDVIDYEAVFYRTPEYSVRNYQVEENI